MNEAHPHLRPGKETSEFKLATILSIITAVTGAIIPILIGSQIVTADQGNALIDLIAAVATVIALFVPGWIVTNYAKQRTALKKRIAATQKNQ